MSELAFSKKPYRITSPPQNKRRWLVGYDGVEVVMETDPERMAFFARNATWGDIMREPTLEDVEDTLREVQKGKVLSAAFKGGIGFSIRASRSTMDQMLRLAESTGGAGSGAGAQTTRDNDMRNFNIIVPNVIHNLVDKLDEGGRPSIPDSSDDDTMHRAILYQRVVDHVAATRNLYGDLVDAGVPPQDARYVALPLGFQTQWFHIMSLGNMIKMCEQRLCNGLTQHETNMLVRMMRDLVVQEYPWMVDNLRSFCEKRGECVSGTMLFPPCGAYVSAERQMQHEERHDTMDSEEHFRRARERASLEISHYDPDKHLYSAEQNSAMEFARWDVERQRLEKERPGAIFSMAGEPQFLCFKIPEES